MHIAITIATFLIVLDAYINGSSILDNSITKITLFAIVAQKVHVKIQWIGLVCFAQNSS